MTQLRIGELARKSGLSRDTIRFYERQGLIASHPEAGATNTYRNYPDDVILTLDMIAEARAAGMTLGDVMIFLSQLGAAEDGFDGITFLDQKIAEVEDRQRQARLFLKTLRQTRAALIRATVEGD